ncbi:MAG: hypothetical protein P1U56_23305 [Saprospiraceae bacterium]|nr:hypothetical protein [Saprospiraceae bacterium]
MKRIFVLIISFAFCIPMSAQEWQIVSNSTIEKINPVAYDDNIEMAGKNVAGIIHYAIDSLGGLSVEREIIYPQLKKFIADNDSKWAVYRAYLRADWDDQVNPEIYVNDLRFVPGKLENITIDGSLKFTHVASESGVRLQRTFYPSTEQRLFVESWKLINETDSIIDVQIGATSVVKHAYGKDGEFVYGVKNNGKDVVVLESNASYTFEIQYYAEKEGDESIKLVETFEKRATLLNEIHSKLILKTPNKVLNTLFAFSKVRAAENIFNSKMGIVHSPGGGRYYAGVWANDQAEYSGPFFPYLGLEDGNVAALNAYKRFYQQMKTIPNHDQNLWSSFEMEGDVTCCGGDRGDAAMIAYGALHYLLALGDETIASEYEPMVEWCLEYNHKKLNSEGVVLSDTDEMESRIETGNANLSTSSLYYGALDLAVDFYKNYPLKADRVEELKLRKKNLYSSIESYFGAHVEGLDTYKYFKEHKKLRHWICLPLVVGINNRKEATVEALFDRLWTDNGVHVEKNSDNPRIAEIFWDRGTLYALRGTIVSGEIEQSLEKLVEFSEKRLLGDRVPYVVEAFPEGNMAHLSAESALYCRVFTEGLFGIKPLGFRSFSLTPRLPKEWNTMSLENIQAFGADHSIEINRKNTGLQVVVTCPSKGMKKFFDIREGGSCVVEL